MSAWTVKQILFQAICEECPWSGFLTPSEDDADAQADAHDNAVHNPNDRDDDA